MSAAEVVAAAKSWRGLDRLVVSVALGDQVRDEDVKLGVPRGRWRRVEEQLAGLEVVAARGYQKGQLLGAWQLPEQPELDVDEESETPGQQQHRHHTRWVIEEMRKIYADQHRHLTDLVGVVIEVIKQNVRAPSTPTPEASEDNETARTLQMLLMSAMANKKGASDDDEEKRAAGRPQGDAQGQGPQGESGRTGS